MDAAERIAPALPRASAARARPALPPLPGERIGAIVTAYNIGPVLADTILSILDQRGVEVPCVLLMVDGCPSVETTRSVLRRIGRVHPDRFRVLWLENGGVSRARNVGVRWMLDAVPDLTGIFLMDGDDLVPDLAIRSSVEALRRAQDAAGPDRRIGWIYSDKQNFGDDNSYVVTPEGFRVANYLGANLSQPSCLYDRALFEAGVYWDESMRSGVEDWEYWLAAIEAGFEGAPNDRTILYYRQLRGNRSSVNRRNDSYNIPYFRRKHAPLFQPRPLLTEEHARFPRFAELLADDSGFAVYTDPLAPSGHADWDRFRSAIAGRIHRGRPGAYLYDPYLPDLAVIFAPGAKQALAEAGLLRGTLAQLQALCTGANGSAGLYVTPGPGPTRVRIGMAPDGAPTTGGAAVLMLKLAEIVRTALGSVNAGTAAPEHAALTLTGAIADGIATAVRGGVRQQTGPLTERIRAIARREGRFRRDEDAVASIYHSGINSADHMALWREALGAGPAFPALPDPATHRVAVILPPEPAALWLALSDRIAAVADPARLRLTLFTQGPDLPALPDPLAPFIADRMPLAAFTRSLRLPGGPRHMGLPPWEQGATEAQIRLAGLFGTFDEVLYFGAEALMGVMQRLKSFDVAVHLALDPAADRPVPRDREAGEALLARADPLGALNFPSAYASIIVDDEALAQRIRSIGISGSRIDRDGARWLAALPRPGAEG